jgi:hypothetical protein
MQLRLRCSSVIPHADNTQSVTLAEARAVLPPTPRIMEAAAPEGSPRLGFPKPLPLPSSKNPVQIMLTNVPNNSNFAVGREYAVDISPL